MTVTGRRHPGADHNVMRGVNRSLVVDVLRQRSPMSRAALAKETGLTKPTVSAIVEGLIREDMAREIGFGTSTYEGGRPPILVEFNTRSSFVVGIHIGVHRTTVAVGDAKGQELARAQVDTPRDQPVDALKIISRVVRDVFETANAPMQRLTAVGVCVPGLVDTDSGVCLVAVNLGWKDVPVRATLERMLKVPIFVHNTPQTCAVAESLHGGRASQRNLIFLYVGSGVGAGVISEGRLYRGAAGSAGRVGHCSIPGATQRCTCGRTGCLETLAAAPAVAAHAKAAVKAGRPSSLASGSAAAITADAVVQAARQDDELALEVLEAAGTHLGFAVGWLINLFSPDLVVVGGGLALAGDPLLRPLRRAVKSALPDSTTAIEISSLGQEAKMRGALLLALQESEASYRVVFHA